MAKHKRDSRPRPTSYRPHNRRRNWLPIAAALALLVLVVSGVALFLLAGGGDAGRKAAHVPTATRAAPNVSLPAGSVTVAGVEAVQPVADLGRVALNTPVRREWRLRNVGDTTVTLGRPAIEVLDGC